MPRIEINGVSFDPGAADNSVFAGPAPADDASGSAYLLLQTDGPLARSDREELSDLGVQVLQYVPEDTYVARFDPDDLSEIRSRPYVRWAEPYPRVVKIGPALRHPVPGGAPGTSAEGPSPAPPSSRPMPPSRRPCPVDVVLHADVDPQEARDAVAAAAHVDPQTLEVGRRKIRVTVERGFLDALASIDQVAHLEPVPERRLFNNVATGILHAPVELDGVELTGEGQVVAVADTGFDLGSTEDVHPAFKGRVQRLYALGRQGRSDDPHGHGTHVAGSVLGDGVSDTMGGPIRGAAPGATLVLQSTLDSNGGLGGLPADLHDLFEPPYRDDGARIHTNSWGSTAPGRPYDAAAEEIDDTVWNHPDLLILFAAGNDGIDRSRDGMVDTGSIGSQAAAKNCLTIGAGESLRPEFDSTYGGFWPGDYPANPVAGDLQADNPDGMAAFSSRGPTREGRIKPDLVAPGTCILSTLSRSVAHPDDTFGESSDPAWYFSSGTSMATPLVAGCAAVVRQAVQQAGTQNPTAALLKALLIGGAVELPGQYVPSEAGPSPNPHSGWGRVDLARSIPGSGPGAPEFAEAGPLAQGEEHSVSLTAPEDGGTLVAVVVWTDPAGAALQNDLDLIVRIGDAERHGNAGTGSDFDRVNTVELVRWPSIFPRTEVTVTVRAHRITLHEQPFALVWRWE